MPPASQIPDTVSAEAKLDLIEQHLRRMDNRDRIRMYGSFIRSLISLIPIVILVWSTWYFVNHSAEIMKQIAESSAQAAAAAAKSSGQDIMDDFRQFVVPAPQ